MKTCLLCGVKADVSASSCSSCGEGSWSATDAELQLASALLNRDESEDDDAPPAEPEAPAVEPPYVEPRPAGTPLTEEELAAAAVPRDPSAASPDTIDETVAPSDETETTEPESNESTEETPAEPEAPKKASGKKARK